MHELHSPKTELVQRLAESADEQTLRQLFTSRTARWKYHMMHDECFTIGLFADLTHLSPSIAFALVAHAARIASEQTDADLFTTALSLAVGLAHTSDTTEIPSDLDDQWSQLESAAADHSPTSDTIWTSFRSWYRR